MKNEQADSQVSQEARRGTQVMMSAPPTFFSPRDQRGRVGPGVTGDDLKPDPRGMDFAPHVSMKQAK